MNNLNMHQWINHYIDHTNFALLAVDEKKAPLTRNGVKDSTRSKVSLHCLANRFPQMNLATECGGKTGIVVFDLDVKAQRGVSGEDALIQRYGEDFVFDYSKYFWTSTPSGGKHLYYQADAEITGNSLIGVIDNVDVKINNGYVLLPPSKIIYPDGSAGVYTGYNLGGPISPIDPWAVDLLLYGRNKQASTPVDANINYREILTGIPQGIRENSIFTIAWAMRKQGIDVSVATAFIKHVAALCSPPFPESEAVQKVIRAYNYKLTNNKQGN